MNPHPSLAKTAGLLLAVAVYFIMLPAFAQQPALAAKFSLPSIPGMGPAPVLPASATAAEKAEYDRQMAERTRQRWNYILTDSLARVKVLNEAPNALLVEIVKGRTPGTALDADMGEGRNAIYLAQQGWQVTGVDIANCAELRWRPHLRPTRGAGPETWRLGRHRSLSYGCHQPVAGRWRRFARLLQYQRVAQALRRGRPENSAVRRADCGGRLHQAKAAAGKTGGPKTVAQRVRFSTQLPNSPAAASRYLAQTAKRSLANAVGKAFCG